MSESLDADYREIGHAGRDGKPADTVLFYRAGDISAQRCKTGAGKAEASDLHTVATVSVSPDSPKTAEYLSRETGISPRKLIDIPDKFQEAGSARKFATGAKPQEWSRVAAPEPDFEGVPAKPANRKRPGADDCIYGVSVRSRKHLKTRVILVAMAMCLGSLAMALPAGPISNVRDVVALTSRDAARLLPVSLDATVTYYQASNGRLFLQDRQSAVSARTDRFLKLLPGDRVHVEGITQANYVPGLQATSIEVKSHGKMPQPVPATYGSMISGQTDRRYVRITGVIRSADQIHPDGPSVRLELAMREGDVLVQLDDPKGLTQDRLLDSRVEVTGVQGGLLDGKGQLTGIRIHVATASGINVLKPAARDPWTAPLTRMSRMLTIYRGDMKSPRARVEGTLIYYRPGEMAVIQNGAESLRVFTRSIDPVRLGDLVHAIGFAGIEKGQLALLDSELRSLNIRAEVKPVAVTGDSAMQGTNASELVRISGRLLAQVREAEHDAYVLEAQGKLFTAFLPAGDATLQPARDVMRAIPFGSRVSVTGVLILQSGDRDRPLPFAIFMRSPDDILVLQPPSWFTNRHLVQLILISLTLLVGSALWGWTMKRKVRAQTAIIAEKIEAKASLERHRNKILEAISGTEPLPEILLDITTLVSNEMDGAPCWCRIGEEESIGNFPDDPLDSTGLVSEEIVGRDGAAIGVIFAKVSSGAVDAGAIKDSFAVGSRLAALAINTRRAYSDLRHHAEYDILTETHNRFSLERYVDALIAERDQAGSFGVIYVDLDRFKQVNDRYGHRAGDVLLQEVAQRIKGHLRAHDFFSRLGGDEFAVVIPDAMDSKDIQEIASRIDRVFETPFMIQGCELIKGDASIGMALYPQDGRTRDEILAVADKRMYERKFAKR